MLKLINIKKDYVTKGVPTVHALKGLTINFRRNEFVAILGQSGCGKTTLLNIIGGLDRYTDGDLIIEGKSTKSYKDGDWDTYRNHSVGFVFQSYNLIGHQSILKNVELALTISGIKKDERKARAMEALRIVGLEGMEKKKPNQLSGGQMQRVAIARSLVNNPEILLADEPTGALDSETSIQIMDLLKEVAKDRLVIMVTHNPDLAYKYANRIVKMSDGLLTDDSNPYKGESAKDLEAALANKAAIIAAKGKKKQTSMSFVTATGLSFSNLLSKLKRTILVSIAGSIGIIGVSAVLAVSQGVHNYVGNMQDDMLSEYPLQVAERSVDLTSLMNGLSNWDKKEAAKFDPRTEIGLNSMIEYLMDKYNDLFSVKENDINKELLAYLDQKIDKKYLSAIEYDYMLDPTNNIFTTWNRGYDDDHADHIVSLNGLTQMYIAELATVPKFGVFSMFMDLFTNFMKPLPANSEFILNQYDILASSSPDGGMATGINDLVLVVDEDQTLTDLVLGQAGYYSQREFLNIAFKAVKEQDLAALKKEYEQTQSPTKKAELDEKIKALEEEIKIYTYPETFNFNTLLNKEYYYVPNLYERGSVEAHKINYVTSLLGLKDFAEYYKSFPVPEAYSIGVMLENFAEQYKVLEFDMEFIENDSGDLITGTGFGLPLVLSRDGEKTDPSKPWAGKWKGKLSVSNFEFEYDVEIKNDDTAEIVFPSVVMLDPDTGDTIQFHSGFAQYYYNFEHINAFTYDAFQTDNIKNHTVENSPMKVKTVLKRKKGLNFGSLQRGLYYSADFRNEYIKQGVKADIITSEDMTYKGLAQYVKNQDKKQFEAYVKFEYTSFANEDKFSHDIVSGHANSLNVNLQTGISNMLGFTRTTATDINRKYLRSVGGVSSRKNTANAYEVILGNETMTEEQLLQVVAEQMPESINIYPKDFNSKKNVTDAIKYWNNVDNFVQITINRVDTGIKAEGVPGYIPEITVGPNGNWFVDGVDKKVPAQGTLSPTATVKVGYNGNWFVDGVIETVENRKEISYTDTVELIINIINTLITTVTIALVAFTSLALVVSCFMIAVITYISTMERVKEIGVIRSLGGRKKDVSRLFIAECLIIGLASGLIGILTTYIFQIIFNIAIAGFNVGNMADLTVLTAFIMVCISVGLNVISGFIPSRRASKQDPVVALRTE